MSAWYDVKTKQEVINIKVFEKLEVRNVQSTTRKIWPYQFSV